MVFGTAILKCIKPPMLKTPQPETKVTISEAIFNLLNEHGPLTVQQTWDRLKTVGLTNLRSKIYMKSIMSSMRRKQKLKLLYNKMGPHRKRLPFQYTTWFAKSNPMKKNEAPNYPRFR